MVLCVYICIISQLPSNDCLGSWADGVACAWDQYGKKR